jgi:hypothetical protein
MPEGSSSSLCSIQRLMMRWGILTHYCWFCSVWKYCTIQANGISHFSNYYQIIPYTALTLQNCTVVLQLNSLFFLLVMKAHYHEKQKYHKLYIIFFTRNILAPRFKSTLQGYSFRVLHVFMAEIRHNTYQHTVYHFPYKTELWLRVGTKFTKLE